MSSAPTPEEIAKDARWLVQALDPALSQVRLVEMDGESYRAASFLDDRMFQRPLNACILPWATVGATTDQMRRDARWIFHIGHVGSTLVARLLGELPAVLSVREPRFLRDLTTLPPDQRQQFNQTAQALFSRTFAQEQIALVKTTSFVSEIALELVPAGERALFLFASPRNYIASILAGENSVQELRLLAPNRAQRMTHRVSGLGQPRNDAELAAAAWACEMTALGAAAETMSDRRIQWTDFDAMLENMEIALHDSADFFGFTADSARFGAIAHGPLMTRYSKALEYEYSPGLRRELIDGAMRRRRVEIDSALAMLGRAAEKSPLLAQALARSKET